MTTIHARFRDGSNSSAENLRTDEVRGEVDRLLREVGIDPKILCQ